MKYFVILLVLIGFAGIAWAEVTLSAEPASAKFGDDIIIHASVSSYDDTLRYYIDVINPSGQQIDSTLWFVKEDFNYTMRTAHPAYQILRGGEFIIQAEQAINNIERTGNVVQTTLFFLSNPPPLYQFKGGIVPENVICNNEMELIFKSIDNSPACVTEQTKTKLIERGWGNKTIAVQNSDFVISYSVTKGELISAMANLDIHLLVLDVQMVDNSNMTVKLPRGLIDSINNGKDEVFTVLVEGKKVEHKEQNTQNHRILNFPLRSSETGSVIVEIIPYCPSWRCDV